MANRWLNQFYRTGHKKPVQLDCIFTVNSTDSGGLGTTGLAGFGVNAVYMNAATSVSPNPNPQAGIILVQLQDCYNYCYLAGADIQTPNTGTPVALSGTSFTANNAYVITAVGSSTTANWITMGVPVGVTPAVGVSFIAAATGAGTGSGFAQAPKAAGAGITNIQIIGDPNTTVIANAANVLGQTNQAYIMLGCYAPTATGTTTAVLTAPAASSVIRLRMLLSNSYLTVGGN